MKCFWGFWGSITHGEPMSASTDEHIATFFALFKLFLSFFFLSCLQFPLQNNSQTQHPRSSITHGVSIPAASPRRFFTFFPPPPKWRSYKKPPISLSQVYSFSISFCFTLKS